MSKNKNNFKNTFSFIVHHQTLLLILLLTHLQILPLILQQYISRSPKKLLLVFDHFLPYTKDVI